jgi:Spy/CpxP family protein refolding chaperone
MINKALALGVIFSLAFNIAFVGIWGYTRVRPREQRPPGEQVKPRPAPVPAEGIWQQLGLTPVQASQVAEEWRQVGREITATQAEVRAEQVRLYNLLQADTLDEQALRASRDKMADGQQKARELVFDRVLQLRQVLNPEQRRRWVAVMLRILEVTPGGKPPAARSGQPPVQGPGPRGAAPGARAPLPGAGQRPQ